MSLTPNETTADNNKDNTIHERTSVTEQYNIMAFDKLCLKQFLNNATRLTTRHLDMNQINKQNVQLGNRPPFGSFFEFDEIIRHESPTTFQSPENALLKFVVSVGVDGRCERWHQFENTSSGQDFLVVAGHRAGNQLLEPANHRFDQHLSIVWQRGPLLYSIQTGFPLIIYDSWLGENRITSN